MNISDRVTFHVSSRKTPVGGTIRAISKGEALCDDGYLVDHDLRTNGWRVAAWVPLSKLEVVK